MKGKTPIRIPQELSGPEGLVAAIIATAVRDLHSADPAERYDAALYLKGPEFQKHKALLGLEGETLADNFQQLLDRRLKAKAQHDGTTYTAAVSNLAESEPEAFAAPPRRQPSRLQKQSRATYWQTVAGSQIEGIMQRDGTDYATAVSTWAQEHPEVYAKWREAGE